MYRSRGLLLAAWVTSQLVGCGRETEPGDPEGTGGTTGGRESSSTGGENEAGSGGSDGGVAANDGGVAGSDGGVVGNDGGVAGNDGGVAGTPTGGSAGGPFGGSPGRPTAGRPGHGDSDSGKALLEAPATRRYDCTVERELELFEQPWLFGDVVEGAEALVRGVRGPDDQGFANEIAWSRIDASGAWRKRAASAMPAHASTR